MGEHYCPGIAVCAKRARLGDATPALLTGTATGCCHNPATSHKTAYNFRKPFLKKWAHMFLGFSFVLIGAGSCQALKVDASPPAFISGQATMILGGCSKAMEMGYEVCQLTRGKPLPILRFGFLNPAEWMVTDCRGNVYKTGKTDKPGPVELDISSLQPDIEKAGVCWLRLESVETYPSPTDPSQPARIQLAGGFIIELLADGYMPIPTDSSVAWCYKIQRTTAGRTTVNKCK